MFGDLVPCGGGPPIPLQKRKLLVGRKAFCDVTLAHANVSSRHCQLELRRGYWFVEDLQSTNGIRVGGVPCLSDWLLPGEGLSIASHRFTLHYSAPPDVPLPKEPKDKPMFHKSLVERAGLVEQEADSESPYGELIPQGGGDVIPLEDPRLVIGRHAGCELTLPHATVSARHCEMEFIDGFWRVRDLGSRNGTRINGKSCGPAPAWLVPGSILSVARYRFQVSYRAEGEEPPREENVSMVSSLLEKAGLIRKKTR